MSGPAQAETAVDLELLLAIDISASVDASEYALQARGLAWAFRELSVAQAVRCAGSRGIAVGVMQWAGAKDQVMAIDWTHLGDPQSLAAFAARLAAMPRQFVGGDTWIGAAIHYGLGQLVSNRFTAPRQVIDLSGDGGVERFALTKRARNAAMALGVVVNGLAIENEVPDLHVFFRENLAGGIGAFVMPARDYEDFAEVARLKLVREICERPIASLAPSPRPYGRK